MASYLYTGKKLIGSSILLATALVSLIASQAVAAPGDAIVTLDLPVPGGGVSVAVDVDVWVGGTGVEVAVGDATQATIKTETIAKTATRLARLSIALAPHRQRRGRQLNPLYHHPRR